MLLFDTNVFSELLLEAPDPRVLAYVNTRRVEEVATAAVCLFESEKGLLDLPAGRRRSSLLSGLNLIVAKNLGGGVLPLRSAGAKAGAQAWVAARRKGRPCSHRDAMIAGTAIDFGLTVVTRNVKHFADANVPLINPWEA